MCNWPVLTSLMRIVNSTHIIMNHIKAVGIQKPLSEKKKKNLLIGQSVSSSAYTKVLIFSSKILFYSHPVFKVFLLGEKITSVKKFLQNINP